MNRPSVLIVEDEPLVRIFAIEIVEEAGFDAIEAGDAATALHYLEHTPSIAALFTDIRMPGQMDGAEETISS